MARRTKKTQSKHAAAVRAIAKEFENKGYEVEADVTGYSKPGTIGGYRPDVIAKKGKQEKIVEVETTDSVDSARDLKQQQAFRAAAKRSKNRSFKRVVVPTEEKK